MRMAALLMTGACAAGNAAAHDIRADFNVRVQLVGTGHAANDPKAAGLEGELKFGVSTRSGYLVRFEVVEPAVALVEIHGVGPKIRIASGAKEVFVSSSQAVISYSVKFHPGVAHSVSPPVSATLLP